MSEAIRKTDPSVIRACIEICDGWEVWKAETFVEKGLDKRIVEVVTEDHQSDGSYKGSMWKNGEMVPTARGVYGPRLLWTIVEAYGLKVRGALGRGTQAAILRDAIKGHLDGKKRCPECERYTIDESGECQSEYCRK